MCVWRQRSLGIDEAELAAHAEVDDEDYVVHESDEDVLPAAPHCGDAHPDNRIDEHLWLGVANYGGKAKLATKKGAANKMRPQIRSDSFDLRKLRHLKKSVLPARRGGGRQSRPERTSKLTLPSSSHYRQLLHVCPIWTGLRLDLDPSLQLIGPGHDARHLL